MRIAWFTPFEESSAIGQVSSELLPELARRHEVDLWLSPTSSPLEASVPIRLYRKFNESVRSRLQGYDAIFYNMGDCYEYHEPIFEIACRVPGIVILHDFVLHHFFYGHCFSQLGNPAAYVAWMGLLY